MQAGRLHIEAGPEVNRPAWIAKSFLMTAR
jgi:hypothetical protein